MVKDQIVKLLKKVGVKASEDQIEKPSQASYGDFAFPCFPLARTWKKNPADIAKEIAYQIKIPKTSIISKVEAAGGYVNFHLNYSKYSKTALKNSAKKISLGKGKRVMVDYSGPNPIHPIHIGHARSTFLGDALANILEFTGSRVVRANMMNDMGLQVAKLVYSYETWANGETPSGKPDYWLWQYYVKVHDEIKKNPLHEERAKEYLKSFEGGLDSAAAETRNKIVNWCIEGFKQTYKRVGIDFGVYFYEHEMREAGKKIIKTALKKGVAKKGEGGVVVTDFKDLPNTVLLRSDGTGLYITSDIGLTVHKFKKYKLHESMWVVASEQNLHFKQLFKFLSMMKYPWADSCKHVSYELVVLPEGKMSSREGKAVLLDEIIDKLVDMAYKEVLKRNPEMKDSERREIAEIIGVGALKYAVVRIEPHSQITFDWDQMLSLEGNTGPYVQYAHTRCSSMLKKAGKIKNVYSFKEVNDDEKILIRKISEFPEVVRQSVDEMKPYLICNYAYDLATVFNSFYQKVPVLKTENSAQRNFRLALVASTKNVLEKCLNLIGAEAPEKM